MVTHAGGSSLSALPGPRLTRADLPGLDLVTHLLATARDHPQPVVAHAIESFFAPHMGTVGCVGVRTPAVVREVLTNAADYGTLAPDNAELPEDVQRISRGVFTFDGAQHAEHRSDLRPRLVLDEPSVEVMRTAIARSIGSWRGQRLDLVAACRDTARDVWSAVLFGPGEPGRVIGGAVQRVVDGRRSRRLATSAAGRRAAHRQTVRASRALVTTLGGWFGGEPRLGLLAGLGDDITGGGGRGRRAPGEGAGGGGDDARMLAVAHATALCAAATEPAAASLAWTILALTQRPDLQAEIARSLPNAGAVPETRVRPRDLLDRVLLESQRLLPSSAIVTRATLRPVTIAGHPVPARCEVMVSSLVAHRDPVRFPDPSHFDPQRWRDLEVTPFEFFPFGAGVRGCLGAQVARTMLRLTLAELLAGSEVRLAFDARVGWQMPDALVPRPGVPITVDRPAARPAPQVSGPLVDLVDFQADDP